MSIKQKAIIFLIAAAFLTAGCSGISDGIHSVQEFFGFSQPAQPAAPSANTPNSEQTAQNQVSADENPFGTGNTSATQNKKETGTGIAALDWDEVDPALVIPDESDVESKNESAVQSAWEDDPYAYSFSENTFVEDESQMEQKQAPGFPPNAPSAMQPGSQPPATQGNHPYQPIANNQGYPDNNPPRQPQVPDITFYPVFRPMRELPRTGFSTGTSVTIKSNVEYAKTNMVLSIPTLNITEKIVIVPLVDDNYPVESLGNNVGLLEGSGPGPEDLFVLAAHNHLNTQEKGPFATISALKESDLIFIGGANDASRTFVVYANEKFAADDVEGLLTYVHPGAMILITCEDESIEGGYLNRRVIFAEAKED